MNRPLPFDMTDAEVSDFCQSVAGNVDRICAGQLETGCFEMPRTDPQGRRLVMVVTVDPEYWPTLRANALAHIGTKRERMAAAAVEPATTPQQENPQA